MLDDDEKEAIKKIYRIMDESGDGKLGCEEIKRGFEGITNETIDESRVTEIIRAVLTNRLVEGEEELTYTDF